MNRLFIAIATLGLLLSSCRKEELADPQPPFSVLQAETFFTVTGGSHEVKLDKTASSAYALDSWLTVALRGSSLQLTATTNDGIQSRNTLLVIKDSNGDSISLSVMQEGANFGLSKTDNIIGGNKAQEKKIKVSSNVPVTYATTDSWVTAQLSGNTLTVSVMANTTGRPRTAWVTATALGRTDSLQVTQASLADVAGEYTQTALTLDDEKLVESTSEVSIVRVDDTHAKFIIDGMFTWDILFEEGKGFVLSNGRTLAEDVEEGNPIYYVSLLAADDTKAVNPTVLIGNRDLLRLNIDSKGNLVFDEYQRLASDQKWASYAVGKSTSKTAIDGEHYLGVIQVYARPKLTRK